MTVHCVPIRSAVVVAVNREPHPGPPVEVTLRPGVPAFAGLRWADCAESDPTCHVLFMVFTGP